MYLLTYLYVYLAIIDRDIKTIINTKDKIVFQIKDT